MVFLLIQAVSNLKLQVHLCMFVSLRSHIGGFYQWGTPTGYPKVLGHNQAKRKKIGKHSCRDIKQHLGKLLNPKGSIAHNPHQHLTLISRKKLASGPPGSQLRCRAEMSTQSSPAPIVAPPFHLLTLTGQRNTDSLEVSLTGKMDFLKETVKCVNSCNRGHCTFRRQSSTFAKVPSKYNPWALNWHQAPSFTLGKVINKTLSFVNLCFFTAERANPMT